MRGRIGKFAVVVAGVSLALPAGASADWSSTISGSTATVASSAGPSVTFLVRADASGFLRHNQSAGGFATDFDFDNGVVGEQKLANDSSSAVTVNGGNGNERVQLGTTASAASLIAAPITFDGGSGSDELSLEDGNSPSTPNAQLKAGFINGIGPTTFTHQNLEALTVSGGFGPGTYSLFPGLPANTRVFGFGGADTFVVKPDAPPGTLELDGQAGEDTVDFGDHTSAVNVAPAHLVDVGAEMDGSQEVAAGHPTAFGFVAMQLDLTNNTFDIQMSVAGITPATDTISGTHIHSAPGGANGPVIVDLLTGPETWVDDGFGGMTFAKNDVPFPPAELENLQAGNTYVNIHTTNPSFPDGAIRGQLSQMAYHQAATGAALRDIQRYKGGAGADTITGTPEANVLDGNGGADQLFGLGGNDILNAQDGVADSVLDCGPGAGDVANRDRASLDPTPIGCETVNTPPEPPPPDSDGDGVPDASDACPSVAAPTADGCPAVAPSDADGDGVADASDACPSQAGPASNGGCPLTGKPSNEIELGRPKLNTRNGSATLPVAVPGAGQLELSGTGVKPIEEHVDGEGTVNLKVKPTGRTAHKLKEMGKAKVTVEVTFTPTGGDPSSETKKVRLKQA